MYLHSESNFMAYVKGLKILKYGTESTPVLALHCQPPLLLHGS